MIEKICERLEKLRERYSESATTANYLGDYEGCIDRTARLGMCEKAIEIVQEVAKEYAESPVIKEILTTEKDGGWIPVETELPQEEGIYLCTVFHADSYIVWIMRFKNGEFLRPDDVEDLDYEVLAWQRIAPYQKGE